MQSEGRVVVGRMQVYCDWLDVMKYARDRLSHVCMRGQTVLVFMARVYVCCMHMACKSRTVTV